MRRLPRPGGFRLITASAALWKVLLILFPPFATIAAGSAGDSTSEGTAAHEYQYQYQHQHQHQHQHQYPTVSSLSDLPYDDNGRLSAHLLVYPSRCSQFVRSSMGRGGRGPPHGRKFFGLEGGASEAFFGEEEAETSESGCKAACVERGVQRSLVEHTMPIYRWDGQNADESMPPLRRWLTDACQKVEMGFINYHNASSKAPLKPCVQLQ